MTNKLVFTFLAVVFLSLPAMAAAEEKETAYDRVMRTQTLRCGYFVWPPYFDKDVSSGDFSGIYYEIIEALGKSLNINIEWTYEYALGQQVEALRSGKADALCADGPWTRSAMPFVDYTHSYMFISGYIYVSEDNPKNLTLDVLNSPEITFTSMDGDGSADYLDMLFPQAKVLSLPATADPGLLIENIATGKADAVYNDPMSVEAYSAYNKYSLTALNPEKPIATYPFVISLPKNEQPLLNMLNQGLDLLNNTGMIEKILREYDPEGKKLIAPQKQYR